MTKKRTVTRRPFWLLIKLVARTLKILVTKEVREFGRGNLPDEGALIILTNHLTTAEEAGIIIDRLKHPLHVLYKSDLEKGFVGKLIVGPVLRLAGFIPTRREIKGEPTANEKLHHCLEAGGWVLGMPERTSRHEGLVLAKGKGTARHAMNFDCPVLPVGVSGAKGAIVHGLLSYIGRGKKQVLTVVYGVPIRLSELGLNPENDPTGESGTTEIMVRIGSLLPINLRGEYEVAVEGFLASDSPDVDYYREQQGLWK